MVELLVFRGGQGSEGVSSTQALTCTNELGELRGSQDFHNPAIGGEILTAPYRIFDAVDSPLIRGVPEGVGLSRIISLGRRCVS